MRPELCDRCSKIMGEEDFVAVHKDGRSLLLCKVHTRDHQDALLKQKWTVGPYRLPAQVGSVNDVLCVGCKTFQPGVQVKIGAGPWVRVLQCKTCD